jgi:hypothetical protein
MDPWNSRRWSGGKIFFAAGKPGDRISLTFSTPRRGCYQVVLYATRASDYGWVTVALDHRPPGRPIDFYAPVVCPTCKILLGTLVAGSPRHRLTIQLVDRNPASKNDYLGLDALEVAPQPGEGSGNVTENVLSDVPLSTLADRVPDGRYDILAAPGRNNASSTACRARRRGHRASPCPRNEVPNSTTARRVRRQDAPPAPVRHGRGTSRRGNRCVFPTHPTAQSTFTCQM